MTAASAEVLRKGCAHVLFCGMRHTRKESRRGHDHAIRAIAALCGLLGDEGRLHMAWVLGIAKPFERREPTPLGVDRAGDAGPRHIPVDENGAGPALAQAAAELG